jgi:predicted ABC-type ATPase
LTGKASKGDILPMKCCIANKIFMIAGPNGAGKTTTAVSFITGEMIDEFLNADEIARGLAPLHPDSMALTASKLLLKRLKELLEAKKNFAFETTGAGTNYIRHLKQAQEIGYEIFLLFLWLPSPDLAVERVANRVKQGGHHIPEDTIRRRYFLGLKNLIKYYLPLVDKAFIIDNAEAGVNRIIAKKYPGGGFDVEDHHVWEEIQEASYV